MKKWLSSFVAMTSILASSLAPAAAQQDKDGVLRVPEGAELRATMDGRTAKVRVDHHPNDRRGKRIVKLDWRGGARDIPVVKQADAKIFRSGLLYLEAPTTPAETPPNR